MSDPYILGLLILTGIFIIAAISLNLLLGYTGQLSLGHVAFFGIGAYTSALLSRGFDVELRLRHRCSMCRPKPVWLSFLAGIVMAALFGWLVGRLAFRVRGAYFVILTVSFRAGDAADRAELGRSHRRSDGDQQHPVLHPLAAGPWRHDPDHQGAELLADSGRGGGLLHPGRAHRATRASVARSSRCGRTRGWRARSASR